MAPFTDASANGRPAQTLEPEPLAPDTLCTTGYLQDAIDARRADGHHVSDEAIAHLGPAHFEAINPYGTLSFDVAAVLKRARRPLRRL